MYDCGCGSEAFRWWFARNRGWLVPVVVVAVVTVTAIGLVNDHNRHEKLRRQHEAFREVQRHGGDFGWDGVDRFYGVNLRNRTAGDEVMARLEVFDEFDSVAARGTRVTDAGVRHLAGMRQLALLDLADTRITDAALIHLRGMSNLTLLNLSRTGVTDAGLEHLEGLPALEWLSLSRTGVTDAGLYRVKDFKSLRTLYVRDTKVSAFGLSELRRVRPDLKVNVGDEDGCCCGEDSSPAPTRPPLVAKTGGE